MLSHFSHVWLFATVWTVAHQAPVSMRFSRQGYWSGFPMSKDLVMCFPWDGVRTLLQGCTIVSSLLLPWLCTPFIPGLATVQICPLKKDHGGWSLLPTRNKGHRKASVPRSPTGSCLVSGSPDKVKNIEFILIQLSMSGLRTFKWYKNKEPSRLYRL